MTSGIVFSPVKLLLQFYNPGHYSGPRCFVSVMDLCPVCAYSVPVALLPLMGSKTRARMAQLWSQKVWR